MIKLENKEINLEANIQYLKGVGPKMAELLMKLNIITIKDLLEYYPRQYEDRTKLYHIDELIENENNLFMATVVKPVQSIRRGKLAILSTYVSDDTGVCKLTWFNQKYIKEKLKIGNKYVFFGKVINDNGKKAVETPMIYSLSELDKVQGLYPIYPLTAGITQNYLFKIMNIAYDNKPLVEEIFDDGFRKKYSLAEINFSMQNIHFPKTFHDVSEARRRLIFDELFLLQLALMTIKNSTLGKEKTTKFNSVDIKPFLDLLPFQLTNAQNRVIEDIKKDMYSSKIMNRLVQGDVGSGKTIVAAIAIYIAVKNGYQAALMAPTTILANQHFEELGQYFDKLGITVEIITSSTTKKRKQDIVSRLKSHEIDVIIGTHSLIEDDIEFNNIGLVITDEQHRFGVKQRMMLGNKGESVETIVMTATPIPRTLSIILYGDLDLSIIDEMPPDRKPVKTFVVSDNLEARVNEFIRKQVKEGRQVYIVCPLVEENETLELKSVQTLYEKYKNEVFQDLSVEFLHGKMKNRQKDEIMQRFKNNEVNILISTTVIEVGISVSNATVMVIENADRFGLAALHQLRGRVGRGAHESFCILKSNNRSLQSRQRLKIMESSNSGFEIAQKDLELRGPGDFFGIRQSGLPEFKLANLLTDVNVLKETQDAVKELLEEDRNLEHHIQLKKELFNQYGEQLTKRTT
ncbi:MAG: ATP-dependent DNA helicase RecG [Clostridia bacterium]|nr:ATP-dependent DNA helicase RecG [Clostridia bacterium]